MPQDNQIDGNMLQNSALRRRQLAGVDVADRLIFSDADPSKNST
jgi:hypothetical protein